ncbi:MAG: hypothetical protein ACHQ2Y_08870 [Candidatus Lutacidiplasmatales archaeon]
MPIKALSEADAQELIRELDEAVDEFKLTSGEQPNPVQIAMLKGWVRAMASPAGRAGLYLLAGENPSRFDRVRTPAVRNLYREKLARTIESSPVAHYRLMLEECVWFKQLTPKEKAEALRPPRRNQLAASIRDEIEPVDEPSPDPATTGEKESPLSSTDRVRLARALKFAGIEFDLERMVQAFKAGDWETFGELSFRFTFAMTLTLIPPPPGEPLGRRNRSPMWLAKDRKPCEWRGCGVPIGNASHFCPAHRAEAEKNKREEQRRKRRLAAEEAALTASNRLATVPTNDRSPAVDGTLPGTLPEPEDLRTARRKLQNR